MSGAFRALQLCRPGHHLSPHTRGTCVEVLLLFNSWVEGMVHMDCHAGSWGRASDLLLLENCIRFTLPRFEFHN